MGNARRVLLHVVLVFATVPGLVGCQNKKPPAGTAELSRAALNANPQITNFTVYAKNSATLRDRVVMSGGDVGVKAAGSGPFLVTGYELALASEAQVDLARSVIANRVLLQDRARVSDVQANQLTNQFAFYSHLYSFPANMPALPALAPVTPGTTSISVPLSTTVTYGPGAYGAVSVAYHGVLRLLGGVYHLSSLQLADEARIEALAPVQLRIAGRIGTFARDYFGAASGVTLTAGDFRIEVSGKNGSTGALSDSPKAVAIGNDVILNAVVLAPNGTLQVGHRAQLLGALVGKDVYVDIDSQLTFQSGVGPAECMPSCDDGNPCTTDTCSAWTCVHTPVATGTSCSDNNACNGVEACDGAGHCSAGTPVTCTALDECHAAGTCDAATGLCTNPNQPDGTPCADGNACTRSDTCQAGSCVGIDPVVCSASDQCHDVGTCDPASGLCSNPAKPDESPCDDGSACTRSDACQAGACLGSNQVTCTASDQCHDVGICDPASGLCSNPLRTDGELCDDGDACTRTDTCLTGVCVGGNPVTCTPADQCHDPGTCEPASGLCTNPTKPDGSSCNDGNSCSRTDTCQAGMCMGGNPVICTAVDQCHDPGTCEPASGLCTNPAKPDGSSCNDGNACSRTDSCQAGVCTGSNPVACSASDQCHDPGTCDPANGACSDPPKADGLPCNDGNSCSRTDTCQAGACVGSNPMICTSVDQCHDPGTCDPATGTCSSPAKADGLPCNDGNACSRTDTCQAGVCAGGDLVICAASDQCHDTGTCDPESGTCSNPTKEDGASCNDANACTLGDTCQAGTCVGGSNRSCPALDQCHDAGTCDPGTGACSHPPKANGTPCNDGSLCTRSDQCQAGVCIGGDTVSCPPTAACQTEGICNPATGTCLSHAKPDGSDCDDGDACTHKSSCQNGACTGSDPVVCKALDTCHLPGACDPTTGQCSSPLKPAGATCDDGNPCNGHETTCSESGVCGQSAGPPALDDGNPCTVDSCDATTGEILHDTAAAEGKVCAGTACTATQKVCRSGVCTTDPTVLPYGALTYKYKVYDTGTVPTNYGAFAFDDTSFSLGGAPFAVPHNDCAVQCAIQDRLKTPWPINSEIVVRKQLQIPEGYSRLHMKIAIDNDVEVIFNEANVTQGLKSHGGCADTNVLNFDIPDGIVHPGVNLIAIRGRDRGCVNGLDIEITAIQSQLTPNDDGNPCTVDSCGPNGEVHTPLPDGTSCSDSNACNGAETCAGGVCVPGIPPSRDDGNLCTLDICDPLLGIQHVVQPNGTLCSDGDVCNGVETCHDGDCQQGTSLVADDGNPCTRDFCSPDWGVGHEREVDGMPCGEGAHCLYGYCQRNLPPTVNAGPDQTLLVPPMSNPTVTATLSGVVSDDGLPAPMLTVGWTLASGPTSVVFANSALPTTTVTLTAPGVYVLELAADDGELTASDQVVITVGTEGSNHPPIVICRPSPRVQLSAAPQPVTCQVSDDGLPLGAPLSGLWDQISGPAAVSFVTTTVSTADVIFPATGTYVLRLLVSDTATSGQDNLTVIVQTDPQNLPPVVNAGADQTIALPARSVSLAGTATDDGRPSGATLVTRWSMVSGPGVTIFTAPLALATQAQFDAPGTYVLRLTANDGEESASDDLKVEVQGMSPIGPPPSVAITAPDDMEVVTQPITIRGTVASDALLAWRLEYRELSLGEAWTTLASGEQPVNDAVLATFDPTIMLNGSYQLRLVATDMSGRVARTVDDDHVLNVHGNLKVGQLTLSFLEMTVPVAGLPLSLHRNYDSRDPRQGDFGYGWTLDTSGFRVSESGKLGRRWAIVQQPGFLPTFCVQPVRQSRVMISVPGGKSYEFEALVEDGCETFFEPSLVTVVFRALPGTYASLSPAYGSTALVQEGQLYDSDFQIYDPNTYVLTLPDGQELVVADRTAPGGAGLRSIRDRNGNAITVDRGRITQSTGKSVAINRDDQGRIVSITDPIGYGLSYAYSPAGDLASVTDREGYTTTFTYYEAFPHHLRDIIDPRGVRAVRNEYDDDGRLVRSIDAEGKPITLTHDLAANQEIVTDRTGASRVLTYDSHGNVVVELDAEGGTITRTFDSDDNRLTETDALGNTTRWAYDASGNVTELTDQLGKKTSYTYNAWSQVLTTRDPLGHTTTNAYDGNGNLLSTTDALGNRTRFTYDRQGNQTSRTDRLGNVTAYAYDQFGNLTSETDPLGNVIRYAYDSNGNRTTETRTRTRADGTQQTLVTGFGFDKNGRLLSTTQPDGSVATTTYDSAGLRERTTDALGRSTTYAYDSLGRLTSTTFPDGTSTASTYDEEGHRVISADRGGRVTNMEYDRVGRLVGTTYPDGTSTSTVYAKNARVLASTDARGHTTAFEYDAAGRQTKVTNALGKATTFTYDDVGNQLTVKDALGNITTFVYDASNRLVQTLFADGTSRVTTYDLEGRRVGEADQAGKLTQFSYDALGRLTCVTDAIDQVTCYTYDELGNRTLVTDAAGRVTRFAYDQLGREVSRVLPDGKSESKTYSAGGELLSRTDFQGRTTGYAYDLAGRLTRKTYPDSSVLTFAYSPTGRRTTAVDARGTTTYTYDDRDRLIVLQYPDGKRIEYSYDASGNRTSLVAKIGAITRATEYAHDALDRIGNVTDPDGRVFRLEYDDVGSLAKLVRPNGVDTAFTHDSLNRLINIRTYANSSDTTIASYAYTLGPTGIRTRIDEADGTVRGYEYDNLYRLTKETVTGPEPYEKSFEYDAVSNRTKQSSPAADGGAHGETIDYTYDNRDRLVTEGGTAYSWSDNGNLLSKSGEATYEWDFEDRLVRVVKADGTVVENVYDVDGVMVRTSVNGVATDLLVDTSGGLSHVVAEVDGSGAVTALYVRAGDMLLEEIRGGAAKMYETDGLGSTRSLLDTTGAQTDTWSYEAFGTTLSSTGTSANPYRFAGERFVGDVVMYQNRARWLDTRTGRFASVDPAAGLAEDPLSLHRYLYANGNPLAYTDPSGRMSIPEISISGLVQGILRSIPGPALGAIARYTIQRAGYAAVQLAVNHGTVLLYLELGAYAVGGAIAGAEAASEFLETATQVWSNNTEPIPAGNFPRGIQLEKATKVNLGGNVSYIDGLYGDVGVSERTHDLASEDAYLESIRTDARRLSRATTNKISGTTTDGDLISYPAGTVKRTALLVGIPEDHAYLMVRQSFIDGLQRIRDNFKTVIRLVPVKSWRARIR